MKNKISLSLLFVFMLLGCGEQSTNEFSEEDYATEFRLLQEELKLCQMNSVDTNISKNNSQLEKNNYKMLVKVWRFAALSCDDSKNMCLTKFEKCIKDKPKK